MQDVLLSSDLHGVARIVSSLGAENPVRLPGHDIKDFPLPLIPPLEAEDQRGPGLQANAPLIAGLQPAGLLSGKRHAAGCRCLIEAKR